MQSEMLWGVTSAGPSVLGPTGTSAAIRGDCRWWR